MRPTRVIIRSTSKLADMEPWVRDVHAIVSGGGKLSENMAGETKTLTFNTSNPPTVLSKLAKAPAQVMCLSAKLADGTGPTMSGLPVHWTWGGTPTQATITINAIVGITEPLDYDVSLWLSEG